MPEDGNEILENGEEHVVEFSVTVVDAGYSALLHSEFPQYRRITQDLTQRVGEHWPLTEGSWGEWISYAGSHGQDQCSSAAEN